MCTTGSPAQRAPDRRVDARRYQTDAPHVVSVFGRTPHRSGSDVLTVVGKQMTAGRLAQPRRPFDHCVEHRREIAGRGIDDPEHLSGRRLLRTCVCQLRSSASTRACISANEDRRLVLGVLRLI